MIRYVRRITLACNTAALVPRAVCSSLQQWKIMRTVPPRRENKNVPPVPKKKKGTVPSRREGNYIPSRPVVKNYMRRPVPSSKKKYIYTFPSRRYNFCLLSRPVVTIFTYRRHDNFYWPSRPVLLEGHCTAPSRPVEKTHTHRPVRSHPGDYNFHYFSVSSRPVFNLFPAKYIKTVPSRPVSNITSHEKPCKH